MEEGKRKQRDGVGAREEEEEEQSLWSKLKGEDEDWTTDEVLTVLHWLRQGIGVVTGIVLGVSGIVGSSGNIG